MVTREDLNGCRIIIRTSNTDEQLADTYIRAYDKVRDRVDVDASALYSTESQPVRVLVFTRTALLEFQGVMGSGMVSGRVEIKLSRGIEKNDRISTRYTVNMLGVCNYIRKASGEEDTETSFGIKVINMSATGVLVSAPSEHIEPKDVIRIIARKDNRRMIITCKVVRKQNTTIQDEEYGCKIISVETL